MKCRTMINMLGDTAACLTLRIIKFNAQSMENRQQEAEVGEAEGGKEADNHGDSCFG